MFKKYKIFCLMTLIPSVSAGQFNSEIHFGNGYSIIPEVNYVSSATIQLYPNSFNIFERNITDEIEGGYGYGLSVRKKLFRHDISFGVSVEFISITDNTLSQTFQTDSLTVRARVVEELSVIPLEFT